MQFKGCYHCGDPSHSRSEKNGRPGCPAFAALIAKYNGLPKDYEGALEKFIKEKELATGTRVTSVNEALSRDGSGVSDYTESEYSEPEAPDQPQHPGCAAIRATSSSHVAAPELVAISPIAQPGHSCAASAFDGSSSEDA